MVCAPPPKKKIKWFTSPGHAPSGMVYVYHPRLALATMNFATKFEVSICIHYEDIESDTKYLKWGS